MLPLGRPVQGGCGRLTTGPVIDVSETSNDPEYTLGQGGISSRSFATDTSRAENISLFPLIFPSVSCPLVVETALSDEYVPVTAVPDCVNVRISTAGLSGVRRTHVPVTSTGSGDVGGEALSQPMARTIATAETARSRIGIHG